MGREGNGRVERSVAFVSSREAAESQSGHTLTDLALTMPSSWSGTQERGGEGQEHADSEVRGKSDNCRDGEENIRHSYQLSRSK